MGASLKALEKNKNSIISAKANMPQVTTEKSLSVKSPTADQTFYDKFTNFHGGDINNPGGLEVAKKMLRDRGIGVGGSGLSGSMTDLGQQGQSDFAKTGSSKIVGSVQELLGKAAKMGIKNANEFSANYDVISKGVGKGFIDDPNFQKMTPNFKQAVSKLYEEQVKKHGFPKSGK